MPEIEHPGYPLKDRVDADQLSCANSTYARAMRKPLTLSNLEGDRCMSHTGRQKYDLKSGINGFL
jgi:hypothetical protein